MNRVPTIHFGGGICRSPGFRREVGAGVGAAGRLAVVVVFDGFFEFFEDGEEVGENAVVTGAFLEHVVEQADADYEFFGVFFGDVAFFVGSFYHSGEVVMATEVEVHDFLNFTVDHFGDVEVVGVFFFVGFTVAVHNNISLNFDVLLNNNPFGRMVAQKELKERCLPDCAGR